MGIGGRIDGDGFLIEPNGLVKFTCHLMFHRRTDQLESAFLIFSRRHNFYRKVNPASASFLNSITFMLFHTPHPPLSWIWAPLT